MIATISFKENTIDQCIYHKVSGSEYIIPVLCIDDILLPSSDISLLHETKKLLSKRFEMKDFGNASFVLGIQIDWDRSKGILRLLQRPILIRCKPFWHAELCTRRHTYGKR